MSDKIYRRLRVQTVDQYLKIGIPLKHNRLLDDLLDELDILFKVSYIMLIQRNKSINRK